MTMKRLIIQADDALLERARVRAAATGVSIASLVRTALERELGTNDPPPEIRCAGSIVSDDRRLGRRATRDNDSPPPFRS